MLNMIKQSCMENDKPSNVRISNYIALCGVMLPYFAANIGNIVKAFLEQTSISFLDIPPVASGIVIAIIGAKVIQKATGEKKGG